MHKKPAIALAITLAAGLAVAAVIVSTPATDSPNEQKTLPLPTGGAGIEARLQALEVAIDTEREARQLLEDELLILYDALEAIESGAADAPRQPQVATTAVRDDRRAQFLNSSRNDPQRRVTALTDGGFSIDRAAWIVQRESELRMEAMQARYDALRSDEVPGPDSTALAPELKLRQEIGDAEYEQYLAAQNRPTAVNVRNVMSASPAMSAGLQPGDQITHYGGERVFSTFDLTRQTMQGEPGANVVVNIVRDGVPMQVVMQRGPLGISSSRRR